jgi:hypothetical protein
MYSIGQKAAILGHQQLLHDFVRKLPIRIFLNLIIKNVWKNIGLVDNLTARKDNDNITMKIKNEYITRIIGKNKIQIGMYTGALNVWYGSQVQCVYSKQTKNLSKYIFKISNRPFIPTNIKWREKEVYNKLNSLPKNMGMTLRDAVKKNIFQIKKNKFYFLNKPLIPIENTLNHLISCNNILLDRVAHISYRHFKEFNKKQISNSKKLLILKNILQFSGWGIPRIIIKDKKNIVIEIQHPPYGMELDRDKWQFLVYFVLGYLWLINKYFKITNVNEEYKKLILTYSAKK